MLLKWIQFSVLLLFAWEETMRFGFKGDAERVPDAIVLILLHKLFGQCLRNNKESRYLIPSLASWRC